MWQDFWYPINRRLGWHQSWSEYLQKKNDMFDSNRIQESNPKPSSPQIGHYSMCTIPVLLDALLIFPYTFMSPKRYNPLWSNFYKYFCIPWVPSMCYPFHTAWFNHPNNKWWRVSIMKLFHMNYPAFSYNFLFSLFFDVQIKGKTSVITFFISNSTVT